MINMAVISLKDIMKYLVKITIVIAVVIGITRYFSIAKDSANEKIKQFGSNSFLSCLDSTIPGIKSINNEEQKDIIAKEKVDPLKIALEVELDMMNTLKYNQKGENNSQQEDNNLNKNEGNYEIGATDDNGEKNNLEKNEDGKVEQAKTGLKTEVQSSNVPNKYTTEYKGVKIKNEAGYKLTKEILTPDIKINTNNVIIYHTHSCESYTASEKYQYKQTGNFRTTDKKYSVVGVGRELDKQLKSYGFNVIHNETLHDYPSYSGSYANSLKTVNSILEKNKNTDIVIDLHRDAIRRQPLCTNC